VNFRLKITLLQNNISPSGLIGEYIMIKKLLINFTFNNLLIYFDYIIVDTTSDEANNIRVVLDDMRKRLNP
jgi:virulence-associated protein VapD